MHPSGGKSAVAGATHAGLKKRWGKPIAVLVLFSVVVLPVVIGVFDPLDLDRVKILLTGGALLSVPIGIYRVIRARRRTDDRLPAVPARFARSPDAGAIGHADLARGGPAEKSDFYAGILATDPRNLTALKHFLKLHRYNDAQEGAWFVKLVDATMARDFQTAVRLVRDYFPRHLDRLSGDILFRLGVEFFQYADYEKARHCLDLAADREGSWQAKALLILSRTYEAIGSDDRAVAVLEELLEQACGEIFRRQAAVRLMQLKEKKGDPSGLTSVA